jgi:uncharacterized protein DUF4242
MTTFLVEGYVPAATELADVERRARTAAKAVANSGVDVRHVRSILVPAEETAFHLFVAPSAETLVEVTRLASLRCTRIVEAITNSEETGGRS